jgi:hypothetical protein
MGKEEVMKCELVELVARDVGWYGCLICITALCYTGWRKAPKTMKTVPCSQHSLETD